MYHGNHISLAQFREMSEKFRDEVVPWLEAHGITSYRKAAKELNGENAGIAEAEIFSALDAFWHTTAGRRYIRDYFNSRKRGENQKKKAENISEKFGKKVIAI